jgi:cytochrome P450
MNTPHFPIATDGEVHSHYRRALRPAFSRETIMPHIPRMIEVVESAARGWTPGQVLPVRKTMQRLLIDVMGASMAGQTVGENFEEMRYFAITFTSAATGWMPQFLRRKRYQKAKAHTFAFVRQIVDAHRSRPAPEHPDSVDMLLRAADENGQPLSEDDLIAFTEIIYGNSVRSAASMCAFAIYELLKNPDLMANVRAEIDDAFVGEMPDFRRMKWLHATILETLRFYPTGVMLPRMVVQDFDFGGWPIRAGQRVFIATTLTHFLPEFFAEPQRFDAARFLPPRSEQRQQGALNPMGLGPHICLGAAAAEVAMAATVATVLRCVDLELDPPDYVLRQRLDPTPTPDDRFGMRIGFGS